MPLGREARPHIASRLGRRCYVGPVMEFRLLGPLEAINGDAPVVLGGPKQRALLARLLLDANRTVSVDRLVDDLWGEDVPGTAVKMVQIYVSQLRKALPDAVPLHTRAPGYAIEVEPDHLDIERFRRLREEARASLDAADAATASRLLGEALSLWRGRALAEFNEPFAATERAHLEELHLASIEDRIDADLALGRHSNVIGELEALIAEHPLRERLRGQLMLALYRSGRQADALDAYQALRKTMDEQLGIEPSHALKALHQQILNQDLGLNQPIHEPAPPRPASMPRIEFCSASDGVKIAYSVHGSGPPIVKAANWLTHLEHDWNSPIWRHWIDGFADGHTLVRYDERGCGLSDWDADVHDPDVWVNDLEAVVDAAGLDRFAIVGVSQGAQIGVGYAVRHPERVSHLVFYGGYVRGRQKRPVPAEKQREDELLLNMMEVGWGRADPMFRQVWTTMFIPGATQDQMDWFDEAQRVSTSGQNARALAQAWYQIDISDQLENVTTPTLVAHGRDDRVVPFDEGRSLAAGIPGARFLPLDSSRHILLAGEPAWPTFLSEAHAFLGSFTG